MITNIHSARGGKRRRFVSLTIAAGAASVLLFTFARCGRDGGAAPPADAILQIDNEYILQNELDHLVAFLLESLPTAGPETASARALESGLLPRAIARNDYPEGVTEARKKGEVAMAMLKEHTPFEDVAARLSDSAAVQIPKPISRQMIDPILGAAVFGKQPGYVTNKPVETTYGVVIARVDAAEPEPGPLQETVIISVIEIGYDRYILDPNTRRDRNVKRMLSAKYREIQPGSLRLLPPAIRTQISQPASK